MYAFVSGVVGYGSIASSTAVAIDRYNAIHRSMRLRSPIKGRKLMCLQISVIWLYSIALMLPPFFGWSRFVLDGHGTSCTFDFVSRDAASRDYFLLQLIIGFIIPLVIIFACYLRIFITVYAHERESSRHRTYEEGRPRQRVELKIAKTTCLTIFMFSVAWTPYAVVAMISAFGDAELVTPLAILLPAIFAKLSIIYNPIIYTLSHPVFKKVICCQKPPPAETSAEATMHATALTSTVKSSRKSNPSVSDDNNTAGPYT